MMAPTPPPIAMAPAMMIRGRRIGATSAQRRDDGDRHADHAEIVALAAGLGARQPAQRQDEEHPGDEIERCGEISVHVSP